MISLRLSIREFIHEFLDDHVGWSTRVPRTVWPLLVKPGFLTSEFVEGRRVRYLSPLRLYLTFSVLFFLLAANPPSWSRHNANWRKKPATDSAASAVSMAAEEKDRALRIAKADSQMRAEIPRIRDTTSWSGRFKQRSLQRKVEMARLDPKESTNRYLRRMVSDMPKALFALLPLFALLLKALMRRRQRFYPEHLVFALHAHAFMFAAFSLMILSPWSKLRMPFLIAAPIYVILAMRTVYGGSVVRNTAKTALLFTGYLVAVFVAATFVATAAFFFG